MRATATVNVVLRVELADAWGDDCTIAQVKRQADEMAKMRVDLLLKNAGGVTIAEVGVPRVTIQ